VTRRERLRAELIAQVTPTRSRRWKFVVGSVLAFSLAGVGTGGIVATAALAQNGERADPVALDLSDVQGSGMRAADDYGLDVLATYTIRGAATTDLDMGARPERADSIVYAVQCLDHTDVVVTVGDETDDSLSCVDEAAWRIGSTRVVGVDADSLAVQVTGGRYAIWAAWTSNLGHPQLPNEPSPYLAYGVTRAEYLAAFGEFAGCVTGAGGSNALVDIDTSGTFIKYGVGDSDDVTIARCYAQWYGAVAEAWAEEHAP